MSFSQEVKKELLGIIPGARHCRIAGMAAILQCTALFSAEKNEYLLTVSTENRDVIEKLFTYIQKNTNISFKSPEPVLQDGRGGRYFVQISENSNEIRELCEMLKMVDENGSIHPLQEGISSLLLKNSCCRKSYVRDLFLCIGSMNDPSKGYHLEFDCSTAAQARQLQSILSELGTEARVIHRQKYEVVYIKEAEAIGTLLNMMGAHVSLLEMENSVILKEMRNSINRRVNCETANIEKTVSASWRQREDIRLLEEKGILKDLPESLRMIAEVRMEYPEASLKELGEMVTPAVGKSGVNHRLRKLGEIADNIRNGSLEESYD